jgi:hypothetical protein
MNRYLFTALGLTLAAGVACSSNSDDYAPALGDGGATSKAGAGGRTSVGKSGGGGTDDGGSAGEADAGSAGAAGEGGAGGEGGGGGWDEGMVIPVTPGSCSETAAWAGSTPVQEISTDANEQLLAITADELDILFLRDDVAMRAHRELASAAFDAPVAQPIAEGYGVDAGAALSADGKTMVLLATSGQSFAAFTRGSRDGAFDTAPDPGAFTAINQRALQTMQHYAAPVLAPDGKTFVFSAFTPAPEGGFPTGVEGVSVVFQSLSTDNGWSMPESISQNLFDGTSAARALPSGLSSDSRTLFYLDEGSGKQAARFRDRPDAPLYTLVDLDQLTRAVPNLECNRLYYSSAGDVRLSARE